MWYGSLTLFYITESDVTPVAQRAEDAVGLTEQTTRCIKLLRKHSEGEDEQIENKHALQQTLHQGLKCDHMI